MSTESQQEVLVIGVGNAFRGDEAAGLEAVRELAKLKPDGASIVESHGSAAELIEMWRGRSRVIVIDAIHTGREPGTIVRFVIPGETAPLRAFGTSRHGFGVGEAIEFSTELGSLPELLVVLGIEGRKFALGSRMSRELQQRVPSLVALIQREIRAIRSLQAA